MNYTHDDDDDDDATVPWLSYAVVGICCLGVGVLGGLVVAAVSNDTTELSAVQDELERERAISAELESDLAVETDRNSKLTASLDDLERRLLELRSGMEKSQTDRGLGISLDDVQAMFREVDFKDMEYTDAPKVVHQAILEGVTITLFGDPDNLEGIQAASTTVTEVSPGLASVFKRVTAIVYPDMSPEERAAWIVGAFQRAEEPYNIWSTKEGLKLNLVRADELSMCILSVTKY